MITKNFNFRPAIKLGSKGIVYVVIRDSETEKQVKINCGKLNPSEWDNKRKNISDKVAIAKESYITLFCIMGIDFYTRYIKQKGFDTVISDLKAIVTDVTNYCSDIDTVIASNDTVENISAIARKYCE